MAVDNSSYTVTNPDLYLSDNGITIMITSTDDILVDGIKLLFEKYIANSIVFCVQDKITNEKNMAWSYYISRDCEIMIVDLDNSEWIDVCLAMSKHIDEQHIVIFYTEKHKKKEAELLVNTLGDQYIIVHSLEDIDSYILHEMVGKS
jgi:hypothetical protein